MAEDVKRTSLSAGLAVYSLLKEALGDRVTKIYPVVSDENAEMPFVVYRRTGIRSENVKGSTAFDSSTLEVSVFSKDYGQGVELTERIRAALEHTTIRCTKERDGFDMTVGCTRMTDCEESWDADCFRQDLTVECKI